MKEIALFTEDEKKVMRPLLKAKEQGDHEAAVKFTEMWIQGCQRALAEYKKHPGNEIIEDDVTNLFPVDVKTKIAELEEDIAKCEEWLAENK